MAALEEPRYLIAVNIRILAISTPTKEIIINFRVDLSMLVIVLNSSEYRSMGINTMIEKTELMRINKEGEILSIIF